MKRPRLTQAELEAQWRKIADVVRVLGHATTREVAAYTGQKYVDVNLLLQGAWRMGLLERSGERSRVYRPASSPSEAPQ